MNITTTLSQAVADALKKLYGIEADAKSIVLQDTRKEFKGDYTLVVFPYVKQARKSPEAVANEIGEAVEDLGRHRHHHHGPDVYDEEQNMED